MSAMVDNCTKRKMKKSKIVKKIRNEKGDKFFYLFTIIIGIFTFYPILWKGIGKTADSDIVLLPWVPALIYGICCILGSVILCRLLYCTYNPSSDEITEYLDKERERIKSVMEKNENYAKCHEREAKELNSHLKEKMDQLELED